MKNLTVTGLLAAMVCWSAWQLSGGESKPPEPMLVATAYFDLNEDTPETRQEFVLVSLRYLSKQPGVRHYWAGERAADVPGLIAEDFDVSHVVVFENREAMDRWGNSPDRRELMEHIKPTVKSARICASYVRATTDE